MQSLSEEGITVYEDINDTHIRYTIKSLCWNNDIMLKTTIKGPPSGCANDKYRSILWHSSSKAWRHTWQTLFNIRVVVKQVICCMEANEWSKDDKATHINIHSCDVNWILTLCPNQYWCRRNSAVLYTAWILHAHTIHACKKAAHKEGFPPQSPLRYKHILCIITSQGLPGPVVILGYLNKH